MEKAPMGPWPKVVKVTSGDRRYYDRAGKVRLVAGCLKPACGIGAVSAAAGVDAKQRIVDVGVVKQPVQDRRGHDRIAEHAALFPTDRLDMIGIEPVS